MELNSHHSKYYLQFHLLFAWGKLFSNCFKFWNLTLFKKSEYIYIYATGGPQPAYRHKAIVVMRRMGALDCLRDFTIHVLYYYVLLRLISRFWSKIVWCFSIHYFCEHLLHTKAKCRKSHFHQQARMLPLVQLIFLPRVNWSRLFTVLVV